MEEFDFVNDINWEALAKSTGGTLLPDASIGYCGAWELNIYAARLADGRVVVWEDGAVSVESADEFGARQLTNGSISFP